MGTTILDKRFTVNIFKNLYNKRWTIETYFRTIKYDLSFKNFHSNSLNLIKQEIYIHACITQLTRIFEEIYLSKNKHIRSDMKTNFKNNIDKINNNIIKLLLYSKNKYVLLFIF